MDFLFDRLFLGLLPPLIAAGLKALLDFRRQKAADDKLAKAEDEAFNAPSQTIEAPALEASGVRFYDIGKLFSLYTRQIEKYQTQTLARAGWSFFFAIFAMLAGLAFIVWGGGQVIGGTKEALPAGIISSVGGTVSAFIAKTFLDVHKLSLIQLNHYFTQPVINSHVLTVQRLADQLPSDDAKQKAYEQLIRKVSDLIALDAVPLIDIHGNSTLNGNQKKGRRSKQSQNTDPED